MCPQLLLTNSNHVLINHRLSQFFSGENGEMTPYRRLVAGALAGATSQVLTYPLDMIRYMHAGRAAAMIMHTITDLTRTRS